jgi:eukaryotic-like serine/threonine-protein kinase
MTVCGAPPNGAPRTGELVDGRFRVGGLLGEGGAAWVCFAVDQDDGRPVALKVPLPPNPPDPWAAARFARETHLLAGLTHPHLVGFHAAGEHRDRPYLALEYLPGRDLKQVLRHHGALPEPQALRLIMQVADALTEVHRYGVVHQDVKPQNILLDAQGNAKLTDFGIAHLSCGPRLAGPGEVLGTVPYLAPEQARGGVVDARTDLYSLGVVLAELLTGKVPYLAAWARSRWTVLRGVPDRRWRVDRLSPSAVRILRNLLAEDPADRYPSAAALRTDLQRVRDRSWVARGPKGLAAMFRSRWSAAPA